MSKEREPASGAPEGARRATGGAPEERRHGRGRWSKPTARLRRQSVFGSQFRTLKYRPEFPDRFGCIQDSRAFSQGFFRWYNQEHRHSGLGLLTPAMVHYNQTSLILKQRQAVLDAAYRLHPERFVRQAPKPLSVPTEVWINKPLNADENAH